MPALLDMNTSPAELEQVERKATMRFQYPSGSRPLEGYTIKRGVGRGGFGEVYFAVSDAGKEVALKLIRRNLEVELRGVTHCLNLKHPNLIALYDIRSDEHDDRWVVMEYVSGASLEDVIDRYPDGMPADMALHWFEGMCSAVAYLHDHGIVHRDLKPANIFLDEGRVKIGDYGLSKFISCSRRSGQTESVGTVHYMAPEIANGRYGREIDSYALGIILYEMLTGRVPFEGESVGEVLMKHLTAEPDLSRLAEPFRSVVRAAMAKDPERRIDNAAEMAGMLRGAVRQIAPEKEFFASQSASDSQPSALGGGNTLFGGAPANPRGPLPSPSAGPSSCGAWREFFHRDPDPVWDAVRRGWQAIARDLKFASWTPGRGIAFVAVLVFIAVGTFPVWFSVAMALTAWYVLYRIVRLVIQTVTDPPAGSTVQAAGSLLRTAPTANYATSLDATTAASAGQPPQPAPAATASTPAHEPIVRRGWRTRRHSTWRQAAYNELAARTLRQSAGSVLASMLAAAVIAPVAVLLACLFTTPVFQFELFLWSAIVATLASWAIMIPGQLAEGRIEDQAPMRFAQLLLGALVGAVACGLASVLYLKLPVTNDLGVPPDDTAFAELFRWNYDAVNGVNDGYDRGAVELPMPMYAAYFACLFVLIRWWRQAEWTRATRVSLWSMAWCGFAAFIVSLFWWFPQPLGVLSAAVISFTVQLASPWLSPTRRKQLAHAAATAA